MTVQTHRLRAPSNRDRAAWARKALDAYKRETGFFDEPADRLLAYLIADLGHLAIIESVEFMPVIAHAEAYWLREIASSKERAKTET